MYSRFTMTLPSWLFAPSSRLDPSPSTSSLPTEVEGPELACPSWVPQVDQVLFTVTGYLSSLPHPFGRSGKRCANISVSSPAREPTWSRSEQGSEQVIEGRPGRRSGSSCGFCRQRLVLLSHPEEGPKKRPEQGTEGATKLTLLNGFPREVASDRN